MEKLRAILQKTKKLHEEGRDRSRTRDYYDLWRIFTAFESDLHLDRDGTHASCARVRGFQFWPHLSPENFAIKKENCYSKE